MSNEVVPSAPAEFARRSARENGVVEFAPVEGVAEMALVRGFLGPARAEALFTHCLDVLAWRTETMRLFGRERPMPRLTAMQGDPGTRYRYSGLVCEPQPWTAPLRALARELEALVSCRFNVVLANLYRDGGDSVGWHSDDERDLGAQPTVASMSLGAPRTFRVRRRDAKGSSTSTELRHGDLLLMWGESQRTYRHCVPKTRKIVGPRVNLTFRRVL